MSRAIDQKTYRTFEEFEREELRRESYFDSGYEVLEEMFAGDLDFEPGATRASSSTDDDEE